MLHYVMLCYHSDELEFREPLCRSAILLLATDDVYDADELEADLTPAAVHCRATLAVYSPRVLPVSV